MVFNLNLSQFTDATDIAGQIQYWTHFENNQQCFIKAKEASAKFPHLVINYLELHLRTN